MTVLIIEISRMALAFAAFLGHQGMKIVLEGLRLRLHVSLESCDERALLMVHVVVEGVGSVPAGQSSIWPVKTCKSLLETK